MCCAGMPRHAIRILRRRPASTATVIASIAIGIGLNTALFTVVRGVIWQSLPFPGSDRLVRVVEVDPALPDRFPHLIRATSSICVNEHAGSVASRLAPGPPDDRRAGRAGGARRHDGQRGLFRDARR